MLTGENGILQQAGKAKEQTEIASEKEQIQLAITQVIMKNSNITSSNLQNELENNNFETDLVIGENPIIIITKDSKVYEVNENRKVEFIGNKQVYSNDEPIMMERDDNYAFWQENIRTKISQIEIKPYIIIPDGISNDLKWGISINRSEAVVAWCEDDGNEGYKLTIAANGRVKVLTCQVLFRLFTNVEYINLAGIDSSNNTTCNGTFIGCTNLRKIYNIQQFDTSNCTRMDNMFNSCQNLEEIDFSNFNMEKVTRMDNMFLGCSNVISINMENVYTPNLNCINGMFDKCKKLENVNLNSFNTEKVTSMSQTFRECYNLKELDLSSFDTRNVTDMFYMFYSDYNLQTIYVGDGWNVDKVTNSVNMFVDCYKLVGKLKYADIQSSSIEYATTDGYLTYKSK